MSTKTLQRNLGFKEHIINKKFKYVTPDTEKNHTSTIDEISFGLKQNSKFIHPKFFYDHNGSQLFEKICNAPEYYLTRVETSLLKKISKSLSQYLRDEYRLVELGSGSSIKTRIILEMLTNKQQHTEYFPIDISKILIESCQSLQDNFPHLDITGIVDTYDSGLEFLLHHDDIPNLIIFLGSSFGNFSPNEGVEFLQKLTSKMKSKDLFLIGLDLVKDKTILENAYDDSQELTAKFNLNVLSRINRELDGDFDLNNFVHHSFYNETKQRIEMYIRSIHEQIVNVSKTDMSLELEKNELIHTEYSHKYTISQIREMMDAANFNIEQIWQDEKNYFGLILVSKI